MPLSGERIPQGDRDCKISEARRACWYSRACKLAGLAGTGTDMIREQTQLLRYSKRECYEAANFLIILYNEKLISKEKKKTYISGYQN